MVFFIFEIVYGTNIKKHPDFKAGCLLRYGFTYQIKVDMNQFDFIEPPEEDFFVNDFGLLK